jgi:hypothetical protein
MTPAASPELSTEPPRHAEEEHGRRARTTARAVGVATLAALGVVFGDIGTSPLYALQHGVRARPRLRPDRDAVYGVISLVFWAITLIVLVKYVTLIMRADNDGEGGIMALIALVRGDARSRGGQAAARRARHLRRRAVLRRRHDHARDLGAVGGRGPGGRPPALESLVVPDHARRS